MILVDSHTHLYSNFPIEEALDAAILNFSKAAAKFGSTSQIFAVLFVAEVGFDNLKGRLLQTTTGRWKFTDTDDTQSLLAKRNDNREIYLIFGKQIVCEEGFEILVFSSSFGDTAKRPASMVINQTSAEGGIVIIPWGFCKWVGKRRASISKLIKSCKGHFYIGDNAGRPKLLPYPIIFRLARQKGIPILPGSDPFPIKNEYKRIATFGFGIKGRLSEENPAKDLAARLSDRHIAIKYFGNTMRFIDFLQKQIHLRLAQRRHRAAFG